MTTPDTSRWYPLVPGLEDNYFVNVFSNDDASLPSKICVGWEIRTSPSYDWNGQIRSGPVGTIQYTVSGQGFLECDGVHHRLLPGQAFLLETPGDNHYYLPADSSHWEFIFLSFDGDDVLKHFRHIMSYTGPIITLAPESPVISLMQEIGQKIATLQFTTPEDGAPWVYRLMMLLRKIATMGESAPSTALNSVLQYLAQHFPDAVSCAELAALANVSVTQLHRYFKAKTGYAPGQYVTLLRLRHALFYLQHSTLRLEDIGSRCGFGDGRYLRKVCRKVLGFSPIEFRNGAIAPPESRWRL